MEVMAGVCLFIQSIWDIKRKEIPLWISLGLGGCSFFYSLCCQRAWSSFLLALIPGVLCLVVAFLTKQAIGYGDGILLCALAMLYPLEELVEFVFIAVFVAGMVGLMIIIVFRKNRTYEIAFVPFLFLAWLFVQGTYVVERFLL